MADHASVRQRNSSTSRTLLVLESGETVDILEHQNDWYRIRYDNRVTGWMAESTVITNTTLERVLEMAEASRGEPPQNTGTSRDTVNFRIEPGRSTPIIRRLDPATHMEVLDRVTLPRPGSDSAYDVWLKVRLSPTEVGWVYANLIEFDVPAEIAQYTEAHIYTAVKVLHQSEDSAAGPVRWYVIGERRPGLDPHLDFDGIRVFTWNPSEHQYETSLRLRNLRGVYPVATGREGTNPMFYFHELNDAGDKYRRQFVMYDVIAREVKQS